MANEKRLYDGKEHSRSPSTFRNSQTQINFTFCLLIDFHRRKRVNASCRTRLHAKAIRLYTQTYKSTGASWESYFVPQFADTSWKLSSLFGNFAGYPEIFEIIRTPPRLSGGFPDHPDTFQTIWKFPMLSRSFRGYSEIFKIIPKLPRPSEDFPDSPSLKHMKPICFLFLSVTRINPCLKQSDLEKSPQNDSLYCACMILRRYFREQGILK